MSRERLRLDAAGGWSAGLDGPRAAGVAAGLYVLAALAGLAAVGYPLAAAPATTAWLVVGLAALAAVPLAAWRRYRLVAPVALAAAGLAVALTVTAVAPPAFARVEGATLVDGTPTLAYLGAGWPGWLLGLALAGAAEAVARERFGRLPPAEVDALDRWTPRTRPRALGAGLVVGAGYALSLVGVKIGGVAGLAAPGIGTGLFAWGAGGALVVGVLAAYPLVRWRRVLPVAALAVLVGLTTWSAAAGGPGDPVAGALTAWPITAALLAVPSVGYGLAGAGGRLRRRLG